LSYLEAVEAAFDSGIDYAMLVKIYGTPEGAIGLRTSAMTVGDIVDLMDARAEPPKKRGSYKPRQSKAA
jgi:hypothetical protein